MGRDQERRRLYVRERCRRLREDWLRDNGPCRRCGGTDRLVVDHVDPTTKIASYVWMWGKLRRDKELAKCQVLCTPCHVIKSRPSIVASNKLRTGIPSPRPVEWTSLVCVECHKPFKRRAKVERSIAKNRTMGPFCGPVCRGRSATRRRWAQARQRHGVTDGHAGA